MKVLIDEKIADYQFLAPVRPSLRTTQIPSQEMIIQMGDDDYMCQIQLDFFRQQLEALEQSFTLKARDSAGELATGSAESDPADRASAEEEHTIALRVRVRDAAQLVEVRAAATNRLRRIWLVLRSG